MRRITELIIHCTATPPGWRNGQSTAAKVAEVKRWHIDPKPNGRGWSDIGYHYLIDRDGTVETGRPLDRDGAHAAGHNKGTIGISLFGGKSSSASDQFADNYTRAQDKALRKLIVGLQKQHPISKISGHNEYAAKACPGFNVGRWLVNKPPRSVAASTTLQATGASATAVVGAGATAIGGLDGTAQIIAVVFAGIALLGLLWVARERVKKFARGIR
ncbi:MAG: hypothetical protein GY767_17880 [Shimia sp.]|nr:hypothetical protein [Shimia sp.]